MAVEIRDEYSNKVEIGALCSLCAELHSCSCGLLKFLDSWILI